MNLLESSLKKETSSIGQYVLKTLIKNNEIAFSEKLPICQDTGLEWRF